METFTLKLRQGLRVVTPHGSFALCVEHGGVKMQAEHGPGGPEDGRVDLVLVPQSATSVLVRAVPA